MFKILDGRDKFYQWDLHRQLIVNDNGITQVHFCNRTDDCSLVCEVYEEEGLRVVDVPNILLQTDWRINVYAYDGDYTKHSACFEVVKRTKPADYVYTETDVITVENIVAEQLKPVETQLATTLKSVENMVAGMENTANRVTTINASADNEHYPTAKAVYDAISNISINVTQEVEEVLELSRGSANSDSGDTYGDFIPYEKNPRNNRLYHKTFISAATKLIVSSGYEVLLYVFTEPVASSNKCIGRLNTAGEISKTGSALYQSGTIDMEPYAEYYCRAQVRKIGDGAITDAEAAEPIVTVVSVKSVNSGVDGGGVKVDANKLVCVGSPARYVPDIIDSKTIDSMKTTQLYEEWDALVTAYPNWIVRQEDIGADAAGNPIRHYTVRFVSPVVTKSSDNDGNQHNIWDEKCDYHRILINTGTHGDEKTASYGTYLFIKELLESWDEWAAFIKANCILEIIPLLTPYGFDNNKRENADGINVNRDFVDLTTPEAQALDAFIRGYNGTLKAIIDVHNTTHGFSYLTTSSALENFDVYRTASAKLASTLNPLLSTLHNNNAEYYPYLWMVDNNNTSSIGVFSQYINMNGHLGCTIEVPRKIGQYSISNDMKCCSITKAILGNLIQSFCVL